MLFCQNTLFFSIPERLVFSELSPLPFGKKFPTILLFGRFFEKKNFYSLFSNENQKVESGRISHRHLTIIHLCQSLKLQNV